VPKNFRQTVRYSAAIGSHDHKSVFADCDAMCFCGTSGISVGAELNIWVLIFFCFSLSPHSVFLDCCHQSCAN